LGRVLQEGEPLVRGHAVWALGRIGGREALRFLNEALASERDAYVRDEVEAALGDGISRQT
jgi:epoxyqueuosine reductase